MFTPDQISQLTDPLDSKHVSTRDQAGMKLSYVEGWHVIAEANRIFGHGQWARETIGLREVSQTEVNGKPKVTYLAQVKVTVYDEQGMRHIERMGTGTGHGIAKDLGDAHESAAKEAETDAMKRALMTFGWPFGLALYDKTQAHVDKNAPKNAPKKKPQVLVAPDSFNIKTQGYRDKDAARRAWQSKFAEIAEQVQSSPELETLIADNQKTLDLMKDEGMSDPVEASIDSARARIENKVA